MDTPGRLETKEFLEIIAQTKGRWEITEYDQDGETYKLIEFDGAPTFTINLLTARMNDECMWAMCEGLPRPGMMRHPFDVELRNQILAAVGLS